MDDPAVGSIDVDAVSDALSALEDAGVRVEDITNIDRSGDDGRVRWTMTCEADPRTTGLSDFRDGGGDA